jgi:thiol:disulfide interchange protein
MRKWYWSWGIALLTLMPLGNATAPAGGKADEAKVEVKVVKLDGLKDLIKQHKGKVVVVDFWADT